MPDPIFAMHIDLVADDRAVIRMNAADIRTFSGNATGRGARRLVVRLLTTALFIAASACHHGPRMQQTDAATTEALNQIADNTSDADGRGAAKSISGPDSAGQRMRQAATEPPQVR